jgi:protein gp37
MAATKIDWADVTINPITGCSNFGNKAICGDYCYAAKMAKRLAGRFGYPADDPFRPTFHPERLVEIGWNRTKIPSRIFLNSMSDWFSQGVNPDWIHQIIDAVAEVPEHIFLVLTKRPEKLWILKAFGMESLELPANLWFGVSVTKQKDAWRIQELVKTLPDTHKFVSFEPLHGPVDPDLSRIEWVIIGAESGKRKGKIKPKMEWVEGIFLKVPIGTPVFMKDNLGEDLRPTVGFIQEFPEAMLR